MKNTLFSLFIAGAALTGTSGLQAQGIIHTISGTGVASFTGDGGPAISATFSNPSGICTDAAGNIYIADRYNSRVRKIDAITGNISTFAGTGVFGLSGLGGLASSAEIRFPDALFADAGGQLFITDWYNDMVFKVDASGIITSECGCGSQGCGGDGGPAPLALMEIPAATCADRAGNVYIADQGNNRIRVVYRTAASTSLVNTLANNTGAYGYSGDGGPALTATFSRVSGVFCDPSSTSLYISDEGNNVIRKIDLASGIISTIAGTGTAGYSGDGSTAMTATLNNPGSLFIDLAGNLYICDRGNHAVRKVNLASGIITTVAGTGIAGFSGDGAISTSAQLNDPEGVWLDNLGNMYISDAGNQRIREITPLVATSTGSGLPTITSSGTVRGGTIGAGSSTTTTTLDMSNVNANTVVSIYPNPSSGIFNLQTANAQNNATLEVYNITGEKVYSAAINNTQTIVNLANQPSGIYTLSLRSDAGSYTQKLTIAK